MTTNILKTAVSAIIVITFVSITGCGGPDGGGQGEETPGENAEGAHEHGHDVIKLGPEAMETIGLKTAPAEMRTLGGEIRTTAVIEPDRTRIAHVSPRITGRVSDVRAFLGDAVTKGETLAELDSIELGEAKAGYLRAKADLEVARANYLREERLYKKEISSEKEYLDARGEFLRSEAALNSSVETLRLLGLTEEGIKSITWSDGRTRPSIFPLTAPFDGTVIEQHAVLGELLTPEDNAYTVADLSHLWIQLDVYEKDLGAVAAGKPVEITADAYPDSRFQGRVAYVSDILDEGTRTARARVEIENPDGRLKPGMFATAVISTGADSGEQALAVPSAAIQRIAGRPAVFVREGEGEFEKRDVTTGVESSGFTEVKSGVEPGEEVVTEGGFYLKSLVLEEEMGEGHSH